MVLVVHEVEMYFDPFVFHFCERITVKTILCISIVSVLREESFSKSIMKNYITGCCLM